MSLSPMANNITRGELTAALNRNGASLNDVCRVLGEGLRANRKEWQKNPQNNCSEILVEVPNETVRLNAAEIIVELLGAKAVVQAPIEGEITHRVVHEYDIDKRIRQLAQLSSGVTSQGITSQRHN